MNTKIINIDINKRYYGEITAKQRDVASRFLLFKITDNANVFSLLNRTVRVYAIKPDNSEVFNDLTITSAENGECKLELTSQMLAVEGTLLMELYIMESTKKLTSIPFEIEVIKSINRETAIVSTNEFTALINGLASLNEYNAYKSEIATARGTYLNLDARLDAYDTSLAGKANNVDNARTTVAKDVTGAINELNTLVNYNVMNISNVNTGTIATIPTNYKDIVVVMTIADAYKIFAPIKVLTASFTASFDYLVDQGGPRDDYVVNITYNNGVLSFQKNARFRLNIAGDSTRETVEAATVKTEFPRVTNILYR